MINCSMDKTFTCINLIHSLAHSRVRYYVNHQNMLYAVSICLHHLIHQVKAQSHDHKAMELHEQTYLNTSNN